VAISEPNGNKLLTGSHFHAWKGLRLNCKNQCCKEIISFVAYLLMMSLMILLI
jgi:acyl-CoA-binding protein